MYELQSARASSMRGCMRRKNTLKRNGLKVIEERDMVSGTGDGIEPLFLPFCDNSWSSCSAVGVVSCSAGRSRAAAPGTRRFDGALYSRCARENAVMMVARPRSIPEEDGKAGGKSGRGGFAERWIKGSPGDTATGREEKKEEIKERDEDNECRLVFISAFRRK